MGQAQHKAVFGKGSATYVSGELNGAVANGMSSRRPPNDDTPESNVDVLVDTYF